MDDTTKTAFYTSKELPSPPTSPTSPTSPTNGCEPCRDCGGADAAEVWTNGEQPWVCRACVEAWRQREWADTPDMGTLFERQRQRDAEERAAFWTDVKHCIAEHGDSLAEYLNEELQRCEREFARLLKAYREAQRTRQLGTAAAIRSDALFVKRYGAQLELALLCRTGKFPSELCESVPEAAR